VRSAQASLAFALEEKELYRNLVNTGAASAIQLKEKEQAFLVAQARLQQALAVENPTSASVTIAAERIDQEQARGEATLALLEREQESLIQNQLQLEEKLRLNQKELEQVEDELERYVIRSTTEGTLLNLKLRNKTQYIRSGETIANISPANTPLIIFAYVKDDDIGRVKLGQKVNLRIYAYPYPDFGTLRGKITAISPDTVSPDNQDLVSNFPAVGTSQPVEKYYEATITTERNYFVKQDQQYALQPGMEARADIISSEETVLQFLLRKARLIADL
jgi:multidrug efflux pump subunit AcrA (membrane-fusion protein)